MPEIFNEVIYQRCLAIEPERSATSNNRKLTRCNPR